MILTNNASNTVPRIGWLILGALVVLGTIFLLFIALAGLWAGQNISADLVHRPRVGQALDEQCGSGLDVSNGDLSTFPDLIWFGQGADGNGATCYFIDERWSCSCYGP